MRRSRAALACGRAQLTQPEVQARQRPEAEQGDRNERREVIRQRVAEGAARVHTVQLQGPECRGLENPAVPRCRWNGDAKTDDALQEQRRLERDVESEGAKADHPARPLVAVAPAPPAG